MPFSQHEFYNKILTYIVNCSWLSKTVNIKLYQTTTQNRHMSSILVMSPVSGFRGYYHISLLGAYFAVVLLSNELYPQSGSLLASVIVLHTLGGLSAIPSETDMEVLSTLYR